MCTGIMITGASGAGKTTLGRMIAEVLGYVFVDIDDHIWNKNVEPPFSVMHTREERIYRVKEAISACDHFVMAGSMNSFHEHFDPYFELVVHLSAPTALRVQRVQRRAIERFGSRIQPGGDMYHSHQRFLLDVAGYDDGTGSCTLAQHRAWLDALQCKVLWLDGSEPLASNLQLILEAYQERRGLR